MKNYVQKGDTFKQAAGAVYASGDLVKSGKMIGVAVADYTATEEAIANSEGVYKITKKAAVAFSQGDQVYYEAGEGSNVVGDQIGYAWEDAAGGDATVTVKFER